MMKWFVGGIVLAYLATLATSAAHLAEWYEQTNGNLPTYLPLSLAVTLEANAFILSLLSNYILRDSAWARYGSLAALALVWLGNFESMRANAPEISIWSVFAASLFVPVGTFVMGKVLGELLSREAAPQKPRTTLEERVIELLASGARGTRELYQAFPQERHELRQALRALHNQGVIRNEGTVWRLATTEASEVRVGDQ